MSEKYWKSVRSRAKDLGLKWKEAKKILSSKK